MVVLQGWEDIYLQPHSLSFWKKNILQEDLISSYRDVICRSVTVIVGINYFRFLSRWLGQDLTCLHFYRLLLSLLNDWKYLVSL